MIEVIIKIKFVPDGEVSKENIEKAVDHFVLSTPGLVTSEDIDRTDEWALLVEEITYEFL